jgi:hypothetical protein
VRCECVSGVVVAGQLQCAVYAVAERGAEIVAGKRV